MVEGQRNGLPVQAFQAGGAMTIREAVARARLITEQALGALSELLQDGRLIVLEPGDAKPESDLLAWSQAQWAEATGRAVQEVEHVHRAQPLHRGMPREELKSRLRITVPRLFNTAMRRWVAEGVLEENGREVWRAGHTIQLQPQQRAQADRLLAKFAQAPFSPPSIKEAQAEIGEDVYQALVDLGELKPVSGEVVFRAADYEALTGIVREHFTQEETLTAAQLRDRLNTSRRYVLAFLEHLDGIGVTVREGDARKLRKR